MNTNAINLDTELAAFRQESDKSIELARENGITVDMSQWLTLKRYAQKYSLASTNVLSNWISRGIITAENIMDLPELNDLRLIRDIPYRGQWVVTSKQTRRKEKIISATFFQAILHIDSCIEP